MAPERLTEAISSSADKQSKKRNPRIDVFALFLPEIKSFISQKNFASLKEIVKEIHSMDIAEGFSRHLINHEKILVFKLLSARKAIEVFEDLPPQEQQFLLNNLDNQEVTQVLNEMAPDERVKLFKELPQKVVKKLWSFLKKEEVEDMRRLLTYKEGTSGSIMTTEFVELKRDMTARRAIVSLQENQRSWMANAIYSVYVTDEEHCLIGGVNLQNLISAPPDIAIKEIMSGVSLIKVNVDMELREVGKWFKKYDLLDAPVVDSKNRLLGIITIDDVVDIIEEETTEDFHRMAAVHGKIKDKLLVCSVPNAIRMRLPWLIITLFGGMFAAGVIQFFEGALTAIIVLAMFIPVIMNLGGGVGIQTSTIVIRGLATGDISKKNVWKCLIREILIGISMGIVCGVFIGVLGQIWQGVPMLGVAVGGAMIATMAVASFVGAFLPVIFERLGIDPAIVSAPFITTIKDITGLIIYFGIASLIMGI